MLEAFKAFGNELEHTQYTIGRSLFRVMCTGIVAQQEPRRMLVVPSGLPVPDEPAYTGDTTKLPRCPECQPSPPGSAYCIYCGAEIHG